MGAVKKHVGFGRWAVYDGDTKVGGPFDKGSADRFADTYVAQPKPSPEVASREYWKRLEADLAAPVNAEMAEHKAIFEKYHDADTVRHLCDLLKPLVKAGKHARRHRPRTAILPAPQVSA